MSGSYSTFLASVQNGRPLSGVNCRTRGGFRARELKVAVELSMAGTTPITSEELRRGLEVARSKRVAVFVVAYSTEAGIRQTLRRIPGELLPLLASIYVFDDENGDLATGMAANLRGDVPQLVILRTPYRQGYGGNQKLGYLHAIRCGFDVVVLLHGDGQYSPEVLPRMLAPFADDDTAAVFGSRMMVPGAARRGGMPLYKRVGNRVLTRLQNRWLGSRFSEFHSGYRAYRVSTLAGLPFQRNTNDFHFDTEIAIQLLQRESKIVEVPIPAYDGREIRRVNGIAYAARCIGAVLRYRANCVCLVYHPKFDAEGEQLEYRYKRARNSLHQYVVRSDIGKRTRVLELGAGQGEVSRELASRGVRVWAVDRRTPSGDQGFPFVEADLDEPFGARLRELLGGPADLAVALDVIEHLKRPEAGAAEIHKVLAPGGSLLASTGNVSYVVIRGMLALGQFNYGKRGILDLTHQRLFTIRSFCRMLEGCGFRVDSVRGFGPPVVDMVGDSPLLRAIDRLAGRLARLWPSLFAYQFLVRATRLDEVEHILSQTTVAEREANDHDRAP